VSVIREGGSSSLSAADHELLPKEAAGRVCDTLSLPHGDLLAEVAHLCSRNNVLHALSADYFVHQKLWSALAFCFASQCCTSDSK
jgi:hypothetical protein